VKEVHKDENMWVVLGPGLQCCCSEEGKKNGPDAQEWMKILFSQQNLLKMMIPKVLQHVHVQS